MGHVGQSKKQKVKSKQTKQPNAFMIGVAEGEELVEGIFEID